ncbi:hypothetical protein H7I41_19875 [Mycobacterium manitobense]|uniref:Uncharacterized protein n=1 Tax=[Mycobacterium] manitobense TaxID=190147 RepID=A0A9X2YRE6_9MYCO|nr:hypothetical protein [[Mycobacterium] manitobense]MCV7172180.1 hypothetical protein [[Mycobacterium] manitobense]
MELSALRLRQRDGLTCGPAVAVVAGALMDPGHRAALLNPSGYAVTASGRDWFAGEQGRIHAEVNRIWPRRLGTTPPGMARALTAQAAAHGVRYRWRLCRGQRDGLADVLAALDRKLPVAMLIGNWLPRHWVLLTDRHRDDDRRLDGQLQCYEPSSGTVVSVPVTAIRGARLTGLGFPRPYAVVVPTHR